MIGGDSESDRESAARRGVRSASSCPLDAIRRARRPAAYRLSAQSPRLLTAGRGQARRRRAPSSGTTGGLGRTRIGLSAMLRPPPPTYGDSKRIDAPSLTELPDWLLCV